MLTRKLIAAAVMTSTLIAGVPVLADHDRYGERYPVPRYEERDRDYRSDRHDHDHDYGRRVPERGRRQNMMKIASASTYSREYQNELFLVDTGRRFSAIVFKVDRGDVAVDRIRVTFNDDSAFIPDTKVVFNEGDRTCRIDLPGHDRGIKWVRIRYQSLTRGPAVVDVYGVIAG